MKSLVRLLIVVLILVAASAIINFVSSGPAPWKEVASQEAKFRSANDEKFRSLLEVGTKAVRGKQYNVALSNLQEAERSIAELTDDQYASLKNARLQIASAYESSGSDSEAEGVYKLLFDSAIHAGQTDVQFHRLDDGLAAFRDAEQFSDHLTETKKTSLLASRTLMVDCLRQMQRYPEALAITQRTIDDLQASGDEYDPMITQKYEELAKTYSLERGWDHMEQTLLVAIGLCDQRIAHFSGLSGGDSFLSSALADKDMIMYSLVFAYGQDGKTDLALAAGEDMFNFVGEHSTQWMDLGPYTRKDAAKLTFKIASLANRQDAAEAWRQRIDHSR